MKRYIKEEIDMEGVATSTYFVFNILITDIVYSSVNVDTFCV